MIGIAANAQRSGQSQFGRDLRVVLAVIALIAVADLVFWYGPTPGLSAVVAFLAIDIGILAAAMPARLAPRLMIGGAAALLGGLPLLEALSLWGLLSACFGSAILALAANERLPQALVDLPGTLVRYGILAPVRAVDDAIRIGLGVAEAGLGKSFAKRLLAWVVPLAFAVVFVMLLTAANPLIESALISINLGALLDMLQPGRIFLWGLTAWFVWPFLAPKLLNWTGTPVQFGPHLPVAESALFGRGAILRSLAVFNVLFAVQTVLDLTYLWGGLALPDGMTYASYAHRGAYPLIATALLAAAFVLAATRPGGPAEQSPLIRGLVYAFVGQNVLLVISSILRLDLYVGQYGLSELRLAAMIWMGLVALGLVLIVVRIVLRKSNKWLIGMNLAALGITLYACAYLDLRAVIAQFNVEHSRQLVGDEGQQLDIYYLHELGPSAIPALDYLLDRVDASDDPAFEIMQLRLMRNELAVDFMNRSRDWRHWTWRDQRLEDYLLAKSTEFSYHLPGATYLR